jgi:hypothetical protein
LVGGPGAARSDDTDNISHGWRLGLVRDHTGHVHLGAVLAPNGGPPVYIDLLAAVGAASPAQLDPQDLVILVSGEQIDDLRKLVGQCIDDERLRTRLLELANASISVLPRPAWTA